MTDTIRAAIIGFVGIIVGASLASGVSYFQWTQQKKHEEAKYKLEQKTYLIKEAADILARSGRTKGLVTGHMIQIVAAKKISGLCLSTAMIGEQNKNCDLTEANKIMNEFNKEIFDSTAKYYSIKHLSKIYFCNKTSQAFEDIDDKQAWWEASNKQKNAVFKAMNEEINCGL